MAKVERSFTRLGAQLLTLGIALQILTSCGKETVERVSVPLSNEYVRRGKQIAVGLGACGSCHGNTTDPSAPLSGGQVVYDHYGENTAPNITPAESGLKEWRAEDFLKYFRLGINPEGEVVPQSVHRGIEWMADEDLFGLYAYLRVIPAVENETPVRSLGFVERNTTGLLDSHRAVAGYIPELKKSDTIHYGQYLVDNVARCGVCHNSEAGLMQSGGYLTGGKTIQRATGELVAPDITNSEAYGIGSWSSEQIVAYLLSGKTPAGDRSDPDFCPINYYRNAPSEDLRAIALFLKTVSQE